MQDATARSELHSLHRSGDLPHINGKPTSRQNTMNQLGRSKANLQWVEHSLRYDSVAHFLNSMISFLKGDCTMQ